MNPSGRIVNNDGLAPGVQGSTELTSTTETMSLQRGHVNVHSGDGAPISDVRDGRIVVPGPSTAGLGVGGTSNERHRHVHHHHQPHHTPDGTAISDPRSEYVHDGTTYATGATGDSYLDEDAGVHPGLVTRIKEAIPGTREHKQKVEREGDTVVYM